MWLISTYLCFSLSCHAVGSVVLGVKLCSILRLETHVAFAFKVKYILDSIHHVSRRIIDNSSIDTTEIHSCSRGEANRSYFKGDHDITMSMRDDNSSDA